jgi:hypothetical protein
VHGPAQMVMLLTMTKPLLGALSQSLRQPPPHLPQQQLVLPQFFCRPPFCPSLAHNPA